VIWVLRDPLRFAAERKAMADLEAASSWLTIVAWRLLPAGNFGVEFDIEIGVETFDGLLSYPQAFPHVPPSVRPRTERRWSQLHQYGSGGELCLEWGPDNWQPGITGSEMVASTFRLLQAEDRETGGDVLVPTRHSLTPGQELRSEAYRFVSTGPLEEQLATLGRARPATFRLRHRAGQLLVVLSTLDDEQEWIDASIPPAILEAGYAEPGWVVPVDERPPGLTGGAEALRSLVLGPPDGQEIRDEVILLRTPGGDLHASYLRREPDIAIELRVIRPEPQQRLETEHAELSARSVGIVGCGSLGAKIATSLARSGVGRFVLVDDDIMRPENLVRHELDWTAVGRHKTDALADRLRLVNPAVIVEGRRHRLGGQESNAGLDGAVSRIAGCDLVIDATADGRAFNYAAAAAAEGGRAMLWAEVFGGGFGGLIARSRPGADPEPQKARSIIETWCGQQGVEVPRAGNDYAGTVGDHVMIADDAAVMAIASHAAAMALDTLMRPTASSFPASAYMIGLKTGWIFTAPFDTWPIDLGDGASVVGSPDFGDPAVREALEDLGRLVGK